jgi:glycosyltransferase involved in cell wall biosynthesis
VNFVSVIVITKNNVDTIKECVDSLLKQTYPIEKYELLFVDGHSKDGTDEVVKRYAEHNCSVRLYYEDVGTMGYARNLGIRKCSGDIIAFTDGDAIPPANWLEKIVKSFEAENLKVLGGLDVLASSAEAGKLVDSWRRQKRVYGIKAIPCIKTVNFAIRRDAVLSCGGFDPCLNHWDEAELMARLHSKIGTEGIAYDPELSVVHKKNKPPNLYGRIRKVFKKSVIGTPVLMRRHMLRVALLTPMSTIWTSFLLVLACIAFLPMLFFSILSGWLVTFLLCGILLYVVVLGVYLINVFWRTKKFLVRVPLILTLDFFVRYLGTFFGMAKWIQSLFTPKNNEPYSFHCS